MIRCNSLVLEIFNAVLFNECVAELVLVVGVGVPMSADFFVVAVVVAVVFLSFLFFFFDDLLG